MTSPLAPYVFFVVLFRFFLMRVVVLVEPVSPYSVPTYTYLSLVSFLADIFFPHLAFLASLPRTYCERRFSTDFEAAFFLCFSLTPSGRHPHFIGPALLRQPLFSMDLT